MAFWLFNCVPSGPAASRVVERVDELLEAGVWDVADDEPHRNSLAAGDLVLVYLGAPDRVFVARAELASSVQPWAPDEMGPPLWAPGVAASGSSSWIGGTRRCRWTPFCRASIR